MEWFLYKRCHNCIHYHPHYVPNSDGRGFVEIGSGHCPFPRMKPRKADDYCAHWNGKGTNEFRKEVAN